MNKPKLPSHLYVRVEPSKDSDEYLLIFTSEGCQVRLAGHRLKEFYEVVLPLLDGEHTVAEVQATVSDIFSSDDVSRCLELLATHNLLEDAANYSLRAELRTQLGPQLNFFHELDLQPDKVQERLATATVAIFGLGGAGAAAALSLAAAHIGTIRCVDSTALGASDLFLSPLFARQSVGKPRAEAIATAVQAIAPDVNVIAISHPIETDDDVARAIEGTDFIACCADTGLRSLFYRINRLCLQTRTPWTSCSVSAFEGIVGPTVEPFETACYLCYQMRAAACAEHPEDAVAFEAFLDARKHDDSATRENLPFTAAAIGNLVALEVFKAVTGVAQPSTLGRVLTVSFFPQLKLAKHVVLRKPWCPACFSLREEGPRDTADAVEQLP